MVPKNRTIAESLKPTFENVVRLFLTDTIDKIQVFRRKIAKNIRKYL